jgi:hypothetical protein
MRVYGADKVWKQMNRERIAVARCTVERLMKQLGLRGVMRGKRVRTTIADAAAARPLDRVNRQFRATGQTSSGFLISPMVRPASVGRSYGGEAARACLECRTPEESTL